MILKIIYVISCFAYVVSQDVDGDNVCYKNVRPKLDELINLYKKTPSFSIVPNLPDINSLIDAVEDIISNIINLENTFKDSEVIRKLISNETSSIDDLKDILDTLKSIKKELGELNQRKNVHNEALGTCLQSRQHYEKLREDVTNVKNTGNEIKTALENILKQTEDINAKSAQVKNDLDAVTIPVSFLHQYLCDSNLQSRIQSILDTIRNISDILRQRFKGIIDKKLQELKNDNSATEKDISEIDKNLNKDIPNTDIKITKETEPTIEDLKNQLEDLKEKLRNMTLDQANEDYLKSVAERFRNLEKEYETILRHLFSKENLEKVKQELKTARETLLLLEERDSLRTELDSLKKIVDTIFKGGVCLREKVEVEEGI